MHLVDDEVLKPGGNRALRVELVFPKVLLGGPLVLGPVAVAEVGGHPLRVDHHRAADAAVKVLTPPREGLACGQAGRIGVAAPDLAAGVQVGAVGDAAIILDDPEHVGAVVEPEEARQLRIGQVGFPHTVAGGPHRDGLPDNPGAVVGDVADRGVAEDDRNLLCVGRPHRELDALGAVGGPARVGAQLSAGGKPIVLFTRVGGQCEGALPGGGVWVGDFGGDGPQVATGTAVCDDAPGILGADLGVGEFDGGGVRGAAVDAGVLLHRCGGPRRAG